MSMIGRQIARIGAAVMVMTIPIALCMGCGEQARSDNEPGAEGGARIASSISEYAEQMAEQYVDVMDDTQSAAVQRAIESGAVTISDYQTALDSYRQCMTSRGYKEIVFIEMGGGFKEEAPHKAGTEDQELAYQNDSVECADAHSTVIVALYKAQNGNPNLFQDHEEAMADCLRRRHVVDISYTGKRFAEEMDEYDRIRSSGNSDRWPFSFPKDSPDANLCRYTNGWSSFDTSTVEELW